MELLILSASGVWEQPSRCLKSKSGVAQVVWSMAKLQDGGILEAPPGSLPLLAARIAEVGSVVVAGLCKPPKYLFPLFTHTHAFFPVIMRPSVYVTSF